MAGTGNCIHPPLRGVAIAIHPSPAHRLPRPPLPVVATVPFPIASGSSSSSCAFLLRCLLAAKDRQADRRRERRGTVLWLRRTVEAATVSGKCASPPLLLLRLLLD